MDVDECIRTNIPWTQLTGDVRAILGNSSKEYEKRIVEYSIRNQLRYKENIVRHVRKNEEAYYEELMRHSQSHCMLYPYHLSDVIVGDLRLSPFNYYVNIILDMLGQEKSYDSLPNFSAADAFRLLGIGRNQYIDLMNQTRSGRSIFRKAKPPRELLPKVPTKMIIEPWWKVCGGAILESDVKKCTEDEKVVIDALLETGPIDAGTLTADLVISLFNRGLVYFDVPVYDKDFIYVPTLDGFVMNRVQGDYFENLLYMIFVAIDDQTTVEEMSQVLHIDLQQVKNAISLFLRLGFARKRVTGVENLRLDSTWLTLNLSTNTESSLNSPRTGPLSPTASPMNLDACDELSSTLLGEDDSEEPQSPTSETDDSILRATSPMHTSVSSELPTPTPNSTTDTTGASGRIAFVLDSTLAAFLMMGNLSASLKGHAVTLFEVGKLAEEQMKELMEQLENVTQFAEGEAQRFSIHATTLYYSLKSLRQGREADLLRGESLLSLDERSRTRVLSKSYGILVAMAPLCLEASTIPLSSIPFIGPPSPEACSPWFKLAIYEMCQSGPPSVYIPHGSRLGSLPQVLLGDQNSNHQSATNGQLLVSSSKQKAHLVAIQNSLFTLNDLAPNGAVFAQTYPPASEVTTIVNVPFPFEKEEIDDPESFCNHPAVEKLNKKFGLDRLAGYVTLLRTNIPEDKITENGGIVAGRTKDVDEDDDNAVDDRKFRLKLAPTESHEDFCLLDCVFGIPLFDADLNKTICDRIMTHSLLSTENRINIQFAMKEITESVKKVIETANFGLTKIFPSDSSHQVEVIQPIRTVAFNPSDSSIAYP